MYADSMSAMPAVIMNASRTYHALLVYCDHSTLRLDLTPAPATPASDIAVAGASRQIEELNMIDVVKVMSSKPPPRAVRSKIYTEEKVVHCW